MLELVLPGALSCQEMACVENIAQELGLQTEKVCHSPGTGATNREGMFSVGYLERECEHMVGTVSGVKSSLSLHQ